MLPQSTATTFTAVLNATQMQLQMLQVHPIFTLLFIRLSGEMVLDCQAGRWSTAAETIEIYVAGDWNIPQQSEFWAQVLKETGLEDLTEGLKGKASMVNKHGVDLCATLDLIAAKRFKAGKPERALRSEWQCAQAVEERPEGAALPPPGTHGQWQYLSMRDVLSDHHAVVATRTK